MFGFLAGCNRSIEYRSMYSRCCQHQHANFDTLSLPFLSFESTFVYALAAELGGTGGFTPRRQRCCKLMGRSSTKQAPDEQAGRFAAALGVILAKVKLEDDLRDAKSMFERVKSNFQSRLLKQAFANAGRFFSDLDSGFESELETYGTQQSELEQARTANLVEYAVPTADAMGYLFGLMSRLPNMAKHNSLLREIGNSVGQAIVLNDCGLDWRFDQKRGHFNPVTTSENADEAMKLARHSLRQAYDLLHSAIQEPHSVVGDILKHCTSRIEAQLKLNDKPLAETRESKHAVVLNFICCFPCGNNVVAVDSKDCDECSKQCGTTCCACCCCASFCAGGGRC